ncbi:hypothetical protein BGZ74_010620 [Mortierella antarctica]|nr:hypothetical protein BGZ74_010620 [Mortierella antarctica]
MGAVGSSLNNSVDWVRTQGANAFGGSSGRHGTPRERRRRRRQQRRRLRRQYIQRQQREARRLGHGDTIPSNAAAGYGMRARDLEEGAGRGYLRHGHESAWTGESVGSDLSSTDSDDSDDDEYDTEDGSGSEGGRDGLVDEDEDNSLFEGGEGGCNSGQNDRHPLYFGPEFHPVTEQTPAQMQLQRQIEQQLEQQQRQEYWQQQYRQQQMLQQQQIQMQPGSGGQPLALQDFILPSAISGMGSHSRGVSEAGLPTPPPMASGMSNVQDQLYRNSNLYNLISGLNVNPLLTEVQRAGTLDLSVLEQELDDVEGGWFDIDDDEEDEGAEDKDIDFGHEGIVREMQPTKRSPTALACSVNLKKSTLRLVKNVTATGQNIPAGTTPSQPQQHQPQMHARPNYRLDFTFDSLTPCDIKLFWVVKEVEEDGDLGFRLRRLHHLPQPTTYHFPAGMNQRFISPILPLYTMSLPELTMQGLPSTSMRMFQKRQQRQWQQWQQQLKQQQQQQRSGVKSENDDENEEGDRPTKKNSKSGDKSGGPWTDEVGNNKSASEIASIVMDNKDQKLNGEYGSSGMIDDSEEGYKAIMEDQYYPLVILIEATKENKSSGATRSLPTPAVDSPGLYLVENQAISTFACFNISSEGGFEIKVMKQKVWINSTNYLIQEIYGFTDSVSSTAITDNNTTATSPEKGKPAPNKDRHSGRLSRSMSRVSRAESIASRVTELTMERPKRKSARKRLSAVVAPNGAEAKDDTDSKNLGKRVSKSSMIDGLDISRRTSTSVRCKGDETEAGASVQGRRLSSESIFSSVTTATEQPAPTEDGRQSEDEQEDEAEKEDEKDDEGTTKASLVMLDAPELFQALLHIASTPTRKHEFAMVPTPASSSSIAVPPAAAQPRQHELARAVSVGPAF